MQACFRMEHFKPKIITSPYLLVLMLMAAAIPLSKFAMSGLQFVILAFWLYYGIDIQKIASAYRQGTSKSSKLKNGIKTALAELWRAFLAKWVQFFKNKPALLIASIWGMHVVGLLWSSDITYALKDIRIKLPLLLLPLFLATGPRLTSHEINRILLLYIAAVFAAAVYRICYYFSLDVPEVRDIKVHTSHIRFSLNAVMAIFSTLYLCFGKNDINRLLKLELVLASAFLLFVMVFLNYNTGLVVTLILSAFTCLFFAFRQQSKLLKLCISLGAILIFTLPFYFIYTVIHKSCSVKPVHFETLDPFTVKGNPYTHDTVSFAIENGQYEGLYICDPELREEWQKRSKLDYDGQDRANYSLRGTLIQYMASKGLRKDAQGMQQLSDEDIQKIEKGIPNANLSGIEGIKTQIVHYYADWARYRKSGNANYNSLFQRFEYWKASLAIIKKNPWFGVGTGDVPNAFKTYYKESNTLLLEKYQLRSHNQFLAIGVAFGLVGLLWFLFSLIYPGILTRKCSYYYYTVFFVIFLISIFSEDTLESQEGVTFFAFFSALFLLTGGKQDKKTSVEAHSPENSE